jgi:hypothetical protein
MWAIYKLAAKQTWVGKVEASTEVEAIEKASKQFNQHAAKLMAAAMTRRKGEITRAMISSSSGGAGAIAESW